MGSNTSKALENVTQNTYSKVMEQIDSNKQAVTEEAKKVLEQVLQNVTEEYKKAYPDAKLIVQKINDALQVVLDKTNQFKQSVQLGGALKKSSDCDKVKNSFTELTNIFVTEYCLTNENLFMNHNDYINKVFFKNLVLGGQESIPEPSPSGAEPTQVVSANEVLQTIKERIQNLQRQVEQRAPQLKDVAPSTDELEQVLNVLTSTAVQKLSLIGMKPEIVKGFDSPYIAYLTVKDDSTETSINRVYMIDVSTAVKNEDLCKGNPVSVNDIRRSNVTVSDKFCEGVNKEIIIGVTQNDSIYGRTTSDKVPVVAAKVARTYNDYSEMIDQVHAQPSTQHVAWGLGYRGLWGSYGTCSYGYGLGCGVGLGLGYVPSVVGSVAVVPPTTYVSSVGTVVGGVSTVIPSVGVSTVVPSYGVSTGLTTVVPSYGVSTGLTTVVPSYGVSTGLTTVVPSIGVPSVGAVVPSYGGVSTIIPSTVVPSVGYGSIIPRTVVPGVGGVIIKSDLPDEIGVKHITSDSFGLENINVDEYDSLHIKFSKKNNQKVMYIKGNQNQSEVNGKYEYDYNSDRWVITGKINM